MDDLKIIIGDRCYKMPKYVHGEYPREIFNFLYFVQSIETFCKGEIERQRYQYRLSITDEEEEQFEAVYEVIKEQEKE